MRRQIDEPVLGVRERPPSADMQSLYELELRGHGSTRLEGIQGYALPILFVVCVVILWQILTVALEIPRFLLPAPLEIAREFISQQSLLMEHSRHTLFAIVTGFAFSIGVAFPLATLITYSRIFERTIFPLIVATQTIPKVAIAPLFVVWFGFGVWPKIIVAFLISFFPIIIATTVGLKATPREMIHLFKCMGASELQIFVRARFPYALPTIFGGLRIGIILAIIGAVVGEFVGADAGLGYLIQVSRGVFNTPLLFASLAQLSMIGVILFMIVWAIEGFVLSSRRAGTTGS